jgi:hypothetical protein
LLVHRTKWTRRQIEGGNCKKDCHLTIPAEICTKARKRQRQSVGRRGRRP